MEQHSNAGFDYELAKHKVKEQLRSGKSLFSKGGAFPPLLEEMLNSILEGELDAHLDAGERSLGKRKNGKGSKRLRTSSGDIEINTPRDRLGSFEPEMVKKRETIMVASLEDKIIGLYGLGTSLRDISQHLKETYDTDISATTLSSITDKVVPLVKEWQQRPLESLYCIVWLDAMYYKVKEDGRTQTRCMYNILGINKDGHKEVLGMYVSQSEGANFWLGVITDLKRRGIDDILIACIDNLKGFDEAIRTVYPQTEVQTYVVHQIRNSLKYVASKDQKAFMADLKPVYKASDEPQALEALGVLKEKWGKKYAIVTSSWENNWHKLSTYFKYPDGIRKLIYTTNTIEGYHRQIRKVTKNKGVFTSDMALLKLIYLATERIQGKWTMPLPNWAVCAAQLKIIFADRMKTDI
ncbi:IS256 family transposase [Parasediminibacterium sp. JCM 36343]|uniref:IS256 family transposase n=1 Tax=Parasediminibacterium sp. JCM 36343 TaxID=3374279 RepID=UPI00397C9B38